MIQIEFTRNLIGLEDLLIGVGTVEQVRGAGSATTPITKINAQNFPYDEDITLGEKLQELEDLANSLSVVDTDGNFLTGYLNSGSGDLDLDHRLWRKTPDDEPDVAELWYGSVRILRYNIDSGDLIIPDNVNYIAADNNLRSELHTYIDSADNTLSASISSLSGSLGTAAYLAVGTSANNIVQLDGSGKLPALDGSALTNIPDKLPVGAIVLTAANTADTNYGECDGGAISRTTYATLFTRIGTTFGAGDGSTTFNKPDLRGEFPRGWDHGRGVDSGRSFGSSQADDFKAHNHSPAWATGGTGEATNSSIYVANAQNSGSTKKTVTMATVGGSETRPRNIALMYQIKLL